MLISAISMGIDNLVWAIPAFTINKNADIIAKLGIHDGLKPLLCASFGYGVKEEPAKEHKISVNRV